MLEERVVPGRRAVGALLWATLGLQWLSLALEAGGHPSALSLGRAAVVVWLCWHVYHGRFWARVALAGLLLFVGAAALLSGVGVLGLDGAAAPEVMLLGLLNVAGALALFLVPQVRLYFDALHRAY